MRATAILVVLVALIGVLKFVLWRRRGAVVERIDEMRLQPSHVDDMDRDDLTGAFTTLSTIRDTYFKPNKLRTDEDRAREAWLQATIEQLRTRYALLDESSGGLSAED